MKLIPHRKKINAASFLTHRPILLNYSNKIIDRPKIIFILTLFSHSLILVSLFVRLSLKIRSEHSNTVNFKLGFYFWWAEVFGGFSAH